jgi:hypothetical protein
MDTNTSNSSNNNDASDAKKSNDVGDNTKVPSKNEPSNAEAKKGDAGASDKPDESQKTTPKKRATQLDQAGKAGAELSALHIPEAVTMHEVLNRSARGVEEGTIVLARAHDQLGEAKVNVRQAEQDFAQILNDVPMLTRIMEPKLVAELPVRTSYEEEDPYAYSEEVLRLLRGDKKMSWLGAAILRAREQNDEAQLKLKNASQAVIDAASGLTKAKLELSRELKATLVFLHVHQPKPTKPPRRGPATSK